MQDSSPKLPRREFLGKVGVTVGGMSVAAWLPVSLLQGATPSSCLVNASAWPDPCGDWQLDDVFTAYPPYSLHPAAAAPPAHAWNADSAAIDQHWVS